MRTNHRSRVLALLLPVTLGLGCGLKRDWSICAPAEKQPCLPGYVCTPDLRCVLGGDGGINGPVAVDSRGPTDAGGGGLDGPVWTDGPGGFAGPDVGGPPVSALPDAAVGTVPDAPPVASLPDAPPASFPDAPPPSLPDAPPPSFPDAPPPSLLDAPPVGSSPDARVAEAATVDAPGTCSTDKDCSSAAPLCLNNLCTKCTGDSDCSGRTGLACAVSGLCVACTANKHCTGAASTCDTATNLCVGCVKRSDCAGACQTCSSGVCTAVKSQDDPGVCAGTCDANGACKSKQGQTCQAASDCVGAMPCADGRCCDKACTGSCEACDVSTSLGTCTTLAGNATPHAGHTPCTATDSICAGKCNGASAACFYPVSACGAASCAGTSYQAAGACGNGACALPATQTCRFACVVASGGCTGTCTPNAVQCSATGVPQRCSSGGAWQDQTACATGYACSSGNCACSSPNMVCSGSCVNVLGNDANNCGSCAHVCGSGGTCVAGLCQPVVILSTGAPNYPAILGVDGNWVYYQAYDADQAYTYNAFRVSKSAVGGTASSLALGPARNSFFQVISFGLYNVLFFGGQGSYNDCSFSSDSGTTCTNTTQPLPWPVIPSKSTTQQHPVLCSQTTTGDAIDWYNMSNGLLNRVSFDPFSTSGCGDPNGTSGISVAYGDTVYWIRSVTGSSVLLSIPFSGSYKSMTASFPGAYTVLDANARSVLLAGPLGLYRVALPGNSSAQPPLLIAIASSTVTAAVEDANGVYWMQADGNLNSCTLSSCASGSPKNLANNLGSVWNLFQDDTYLYWTGNTAGQGLVLRLAK